MFGGQPLKGAAQPALGDPPVAERAAVDQQAGGEHHARPGGEHLAWAAGDVDLGDLEGMILADPGEYLPGVLAIAAVFLGEQRDLGHDDGCSPALMSASRLVVGRNIVYLGGPP